MQTSMLRNVLIYNAVIEAVKQQMEAAAYYLIFYLMM
jgi:hypothetical protein